MKSRLMHSRVCLYAAAAVFAGCAGQAVAPLLPAATETASARNATVFATVYRFKGSPDATRPARNLTAADGKLYGTAVRGGTGACEGGGCGAVYEIAALGRERVTYSFTGHHTDGELPIGSLVFYRGWLYGTTQTGGTRDRGTVFAVTPGGAELVIYDFRGDGDGAIPVGNLIVSKDKLYGTTRYGGVPGRAGCGTVFSIDIPGQRESVLHQFGCDTGDGMEPRGGLTELSGRLYGTTSRGGRHNLGTVFSIDLPGAERVVYSFAGGTDGAIPVSNLLAQSGSLYGTTRLGGTSSCDYAGKRFGCGTIFRLTPSGSERVLYAFNDAPDGAEPYAGLTYARGAFYGTTESGGEHAKGTVFRFAGDKETVLHSFSGSDGMNPEASLTPYRGAFYGTTRYGGKTNLGGTVFRIQP